ncbi:MAG TPA: phosphoribosylanthranilate isomerase, partial [Balneola sp.]|nr:phosphoribosylanthranilate isomerase [Balneola sp.]
MSKSTKIKICGITNLEDGRFASGLFVDYLGFIFYNKSPRFIEPA